MRAGASLCFLLCMARPAFAGPTSDTPTAAPAPSSAESEPGANRIATPWGVTLGLRLGWGVPMGDRTTADTQPSNYTGTAPIWIDGGVSGEPQAACGHRHGHGSL